MNNENLTQAEASERSRLISVDSYDVHVDLTNAADINFASYPTATTVKFSAEEGSSTFIDYIHHSIESVKLNGTDILPSKVVDGSRIKLENLQTENVLTIKGNSYYSRSGEGLHRFFDPNDGKVYLYTQYEPADCRRVFPNFEQPDLKAVFNFRITAPKHWVVSSNGVLQNTIEDPSNSEITKRVFAPTKRISTYITTLLAGEYFVATDTYEPTSKTNSGNIPLVAYCRQSLKEAFDYQDIFKVTKQGLDYFQDLFDYPYPFPKYEQAFVPEYNLGAMENPGLVTFTESYLFESGATKAQLESRTNVICHEMSHMWFGDLVTMKWWNDLWLKESFADFMGHLGAIEACGYEDSWVTFANRRKAWAYTQDQMPTTHPIVADIPHLEAAKQNFDGITYAKGASTLKQLVAYVGFDTFIEAARRYFKKHEYQNTELSDFIAVLDEVSDRDIPTWAEAWLKTSGLTTFTTERVYSDGELQKLNIRQELPAQVPAKLGRPHQLKLETFKLVDEKFVSSALIDIEYPAGDVPEISVSLDDEQRQKVSEADLLVLNAEDLTYAKVYLQEADGQEKAFKYVSTIESTLTRGLIWGSFWNQVRDAKLSTKKFVTSVEHNIGLEPSATLLSNLMTQAQSAIEVYTAREAREPMFDSLYSATFEELEKAQPGSDVQLILVRSLLALSAETSLGLEFCEEVSRGATEMAQGDIDGIQGVKHNQTLGWSALIALAAQDKTTADVLKQAHDKNPTATAQRGYAMAVAALPHDSNKQQAFDDVFENQNLSNDQLTSTAQGFKLSASELQASFAEKYFEKLEHTWSDRSIGMASRVVNGLFPNPMASKNARFKDNEVIRLTEKWLENHEDAPSALRRLIIENLDSSLRSIKAQSINK